MADNFHHLGVLVSSVDVGRDRWAAVTGWTFSPVTRYRCEHWRDRSNRCDWGNRSNRGEWSHRRDWRNRRDWGDWGDGSLALLGRVA